MTGRRKNADFRESDAGRWTEAVTAAANPVLSGLNQTGKKSEWGLSNWPQSRVSNVMPFNGRDKRFSIVAELLNDKNKVIGTQTFNTSGSWSFNFDPVISMRTSTSGVQTVTFPRINVYDVTDLMTIRFASVDGKAADVVAKSGVLQITTQADYRDAGGFHYDGRGYGWDGYDKAGYNRDGFDRKGFNKEGYTVDGFFYDKEGYDRDGYNSLGVHRNYKWSPLSSYFETLYTIRPGFSSKAANGFTVGLFGAYGSFSFDKVVSDEPTNNTVTVNGETTYYDVSLCEFVVGYTLNLLRARHWGLGLPLGVGRNNLEIQLVLEAGLQLRFWMLDIRGTYRIIGFRDNSFTISRGLCVFPSRNK
jgi:hypothetical protein